MTHIERAQAQGVWYAQKQPGNFEDFFDAIYDEYSTSDKNYEEVLSTFKFKKDGESEEEANSGTDEEVEEATDDENMSTDEEKDEFEQQSLINCPISLNTIDSILLLVHNAIAGMSKVTLQALWSVIANSDQKKKERFDIDYKNAVDTDTSSQSSDAEEELTTTATPQSRSLSFEKLEIIRSLFSGARRGSLTLSKKTVFYLFVDIQSYEQ